MILGLMHGHTNKQWHAVLGHFLLDALLVFLSFLVATWIRFGIHWDLILEDYDLEWATSPNVDWERIFGDYAVSLALGSLVMPCMLYVLGLYGNRIQHNIARRIVFKVSLAIVATVIALAALFYVNFSARIGRGVMLMGTVLMFAGVLGHHLLRRVRQVRVKERVALLVTEVGLEIPDNELIDRLGIWYDIVGTFSPAGIEGPGGFPRLGAVDDLARSCAEHEIDRLLCPDRELRKPERYQVFTQLRYGGVVVMPLIHAFEEIHQMVPLRLVTPDWLLSASTTPEMFYIKKLKRAFDIVVSLAGLVALGPALLLGMVAVRLTSPGPIFYRQRRVGRFGREFDVIKLRTMRTDAEKNGAVWAASQSRDPRVTPVGGFLRRYRIDEIPQIFNVLRGEMSFVGPRPERPEFVKSLNLAIPYNSERLMVQPGITGWAQVNYPYGSSVADAARKLEYDLYYLKHMGLFLDLFILLDTVRIVLKGGLGDPQAKAASEAGRSSASPFPIQAGEPGRPG